MPTKKIADVSYCGSADHNPPNMIVLPAGIYEHTCSACGATTTFTVMRVTCGTALHGVPRDNVTVIDGPRLDHDPSKDLTVGPKPSVTPRVSEGYFGPYGYGVGAYS